MRFLATHVSLFPPALRLSITLLVVHIAYISAPVSAAAMNSDSLRPYLPAGAQIRINDEYTVNIPSAQYWDPVYHVLDGPTTIRYARLALEPQKYRFDDAADRGPYTCFFHSPSDSMPTDTFTTRSGDYLIVTSIHGDDHEDNLDRNGRPRKPYIADVVICYSIPQPATSFVIWLDEIGGDSPVGTVMLVDGSAPAGFVFKEPKLIRKAAMLSWPGMHDFTRQLRIQSGDAPGPSCQLVLKDGDTRYGFSPGKPQTIETDILRYFTGVRCFSPT